MTRDEARRELAESLILLAESLFDDETAGDYKADEVTGELKITSTTRNGTTIIAIKNWDYEASDVDADYWADVIE
jgi:hypothetical protein